MNISQPFIHRPIATSLQFHNRANDQIIDAEPPKPRHEHYIWRKAYAELEERGV